MTGIEQLLFIAPVRCKVEEKPICAFKKHSFKRVDMVRSSYQY